LPVPSDLEEQTSREREVRQIGSALHDLCQPLTTLQCRLEMAGLIGTAEAYREAVETGLEECVRLSKAVGAMREAVGAATQRAAGAVR
jgi:hypothetical protein